MSFFDKLRDPLPSNTKVVKESSEPGFVKEGMEDPEDITINPDIDPEDLETVDDFERPESLELSPEEDAEADAIIGIAATPVVLKEFLSQEAVMEFLESEEFDIAVEEGFALEGTRATFESVTAELFTEAKFYSKNQVRFTKEARTNQLFEICVQAIARAKNDPVYLTLAKVQNMRRKLKAVLRQRYKAQAMKKAKEYIVRLRRSKSPVIANVAKKIG